MQMQTWINQFLKTPVSQCSYIVITFKSESHFMSFVRGKPFRLSFENFLILVREHLFDFQEKENIRFSKCQTLCKNDCQQNKISGKRRKYILCLIYSVLNQLKLYLRNWRWMKNFGRKFVATPTWCTWHL